MSKITGVLVAPLVALPAIAGPASAAPAKNQRFFATGRLEAPAITIVANGIINGAGSLAAESVDYRPADKTYHETDLAIIGAGRLTISVDGRFDVWPFTLDPRTCQQHGNMTGTWSIADGGGDLTGATGGGTFSGRFFVFARRGPAGCDTTLKGFVAGPLTGTVTLGGAHRTS